MYILNTKSLFNNTIKLLIIKNIYENDLKLIGKYTEFGDFYVKIRDKYVYNNAHNNSMKPQMSL